MDQPSHYEEEIGHTPPAPREVHLSEKGPATLVTALALPALNDYIDPTKKQ